MPKKKKKVAKKSKKSKKEELPMLLKKSTVRDFVKEMGFNCGGDAVDALNVELARTIKRSVKRTEANKRGTLKSRDV